MIRAYLKATAKATWGLVGDEIHDDPTPRVRSDPGGPPK
jgi:hypothetical protein